MEYKSEAALFGLPLIHLCLGTSSDSGYRRGVATGWIAVGDVAVGIVFAAGGMAIGGIAVGGLAVGIAALAGLAVGVVALGGGALGVMAIGGAAIAWHAAIGGLAIAHEFALGGLAIGAHVVRPPPGQLWPGHPQAPLRGVDVVLFVAIVPMLLLIAHRVQNWRIDATRRKDRSRRR